MVGVPGRSKGCHTCIQRRVKCDLGKPSCNNCQRTNRLCTGYKRKLGYVFSSDMAFPDAGGRLQSDETTVVHQGRWRKTSTREPGQPKFPATMPLSLDKRLAPYLQATPCQVRVSSSDAVRQQFHYLFMTEHLPEEMRSSTHSAGALKPDLLLQLQEMDIRSPVLETALSAFFAARVARKHQDIGLVARSRDLYLGAIGQLQQVLRSPQGRLSEETLAACVMLALFELSESHPESARGAFQTHQQGALSLLELRGPEACTSPLGLNILLAARNIMVGTSLWYRFESFLSRREWIETPWSQFRKTIVDEVMDQLLLLPAVFCQYDQLMASKPGKKALESGLRDVISKCLTIDFSLRQLYDGLQRSIASPLYRAELSTLSSRADDEKLGKVFPVSFHFTGFHVAQAVTTYWSSLISVHYQLMSTYRRAATLETSLSPAYCEERTRFHADEWRRAARNTCQAAEYMSQKSMGELGSISIVTFLRACKMCFMIDVGYDWGREIRWVEEQIDRMEDSFVMGGNKAAPH
ncbi:hypothetical protein GQ53DRAFT_837646 [Thozetella sp. PMI_491]|nr:hypothetical protein GQ53DRAFT_837646 [Thozetella sp. PMI_491]